MAIVVATERKWISKEMALNRLIKITDFLIKADSYHGIYPHFIDGNTGKTVPFSSLDNGADIVETSYLLMGLLTARQYFTGKSIKEEYLKKRIGQIWNSANWACSTAYSETPDGFYDNAIGKNGASLKTALHSIIRTHTFLDYDAPTSIWWYTYFKQTDWNTDGYFIDMCSSSC